ncbi:MAG: molybdopterin-guanine dinucleotide biosynthesis protein B [Selenomonas sp.]|uniref:molybdopterin-guanine dinucleotide biosynthesis protein B n=1 Tax=Selenomonas sp. TaxID=2053611 RepID=UPI0025E771D5|nr:molybdopterin-guanine dinucleotide biosynthesis protein B [Selenomonas sp.]MCR5758657.1 molybdopterin-guanine dinucleotide biosynthesis protein B [Selenomonas sp.]
MDFADIGVLIIAGGKSSRMGQDKRFLPMDDCSMLEMILRRTTQQAFAEAYLCGECDSAAGLAALGKKYGLELLQDSRQGAGPLEGLRSGLAKMRTDYALALSCDMPLFHFAAVKPLLAEAQGELAVIPVVNGRRQPLAGLYHRDLLPMVEQALISGAYKIGQVIDGVPHKLVQMADNDVFFNVNRPADFRLVAGRLANAKRQIPLITVSAPQSNTGKTTFIERLIPALRACGLRVGVVKGDCHGYDVDEEGKDSYRFKQAGAAGVAVVSPKGYFIQQKTIGRASLVEIAGHLADVDLVIIESRNHGILPKISLWRGLGKVIADEETVAIFSSGEHGEQAISQYDINDIEGAARLVRFLCGR